MNMESDPRHHQPFRDYDMDMGYYPEIKKFVFDHAQYALNRSVSMDLRNFSVGTKTRKIPICVLPNSDLPGVVLRPRKNRVGADYNIPVFNHPVLIETIEYDVFPLLANILDQDMFGTQRRDWSGEDEAQVTVYDYFRQRVYLGLYFGTQRQIAYHYTLRKDFTYDAGPPINNQIYLPCMALPYEDHRFSGNTNARRNVKWTNRIIPPAVAQLVFECFDEMNVLIDTVIINLNTAKSNEALLPNCHYFRPYLLTDNTISSGLNFYVG